MYSTLSCSALQNCPKIKALVSFLILFLFSPHGVLAQWSQNLNINNPISTAVNYQLTPSMTSDGAGGAIIVWQDYRNGNSDIYAQRINSSGVVQWTVDGVPISVDLNDQYNPVITEDGTGGAIIAWMDIRSVNNGIYTQRIDASGVVQWTTNGVALCAVITLAGSSRTLPKITGDGVGGAIITWSDTRNSINNDDLFAQRINSAGVVQWITDGIAISTAASEQTFPTITTDGTGGAIITWQDNRNKTIISDDYDIYTQQINGAGVTQWTADGVSISTAAGNQERPTIISDNSGGAIITWGDGDIYAQHINSTGTVQWSLNGVVISTASNNQFYPNITSDNSGGAIITWGDSRNGEDDIYTQRVNNTGVVEWTANGVAISTATHYQNFSTITNDGAGGAIITWNDNRSGNYDIYAQRINSAGTVQWTSNGVAISTAQFEQFRPIIIGNSIDGAIIAWRDARNGDAGGGSYDIYAQSVSHGGNLGNSSSISGKKFLDANGDCIQNPGEYSLSNWIIKLEPGPRYAITNESGEYSFLTVGAGNYTISEVYDSTLWIQTCPPPPGSYSVDIIDNQPITEINFGNQPAQSIQDLAVSVGTNFPWPLRSACCGQEMTYQINYSNAGTIPVLDATLEVDLSTFALYQATTLNTPTVNPPTATTGNILVYNLPSPLLPGASGVIGVNVLLTCSADSTPMIITPIYIDSVGDVKQSNNFVTAEDQATCSLDPNDMSVTPQGCGVDGYITAVDSLTYMIRLQNLGGGPAYHIVARDTLDSDLDLSTVTTLGSSHPFVLTKNGNELIWTFWGITLPSKVTNEPGSHGYVRFKVKQHAGNPSSTVIQNRAGIYFDLNLPVITNQTINTTTADPVPSADFVITPSCVGNNCTYSFTYTGGTPGATFDWNFGSGATPATSTDQDPTGILYSTFSEKVVSLRVSLGGCISEPAVRNFTNPSTAPQFNVQRRWNLVSLPYQVVNYTKSAIFPDATSNAFAFEGGYNAHDTLRNGIGYWLKFGYAHNIFLNGTPITSDSVELTEGWNLIGSISQPIAVSNITSIPPGLVTSQFFSYGTGYTPATMIEPGKGYWVKVNEAGTLLLTSILSKSSQHGKIKIVATSELPPPPPDGEINTTTSVLPDKFSLTQNYPNPFNPTTKFGFRMADFGVVTLKVYDVFGREVSTLLDRKEYESGDYEVLFNASNLATGVYFYRINIVGQDGIVSYTDIKRAILIK